MNISLRTHLLAILCILSGPLKAQPVFTPKNTTIFFDLHDVVLKRDTMARFKLAMKNMRASLNLTLSGVSRRDCANGEAYALKLKKHGYAKEAELVRQFSAAYKVNQDVVEIMQLLQAKGYTVSMASNIGEQHLEDLMNLNVISGKHRKAHGKIRNALELFQDLVFVDYLSNDVIAKPNPEYFEMLKDIATDKARVIFIDDNMQNVTVAQCCGLQGIHFTSAKQLRRDLQKLGIL